MTPFGTTRDGQQVHAVTLRAGALQATVLTFGAILQDVRLDGVAHGLTLGSDRLGDYEEVMVYHGPIIGPLANRIGPARVTIDGMTYELVRNQDGRIHLHSGRAGTQFRIWEVAEQSDTHVVLACDLVDGEAGLPGNRRITARFEVRPPQSLHLSIRGTTDAKTLMNFANHSYWNFDGTARFEGHRLQIKAEHYLPVDGHIVPTGEVAPVAGTAYDFRATRAIGPQAPFLDTNFCLSDAAQPTRPVLTLEGTSGVGMEMSTNLPGVQIYTGPDGLRPDKPPYEGVAVEAQYWPDAPSNPTFPSIAFGPGTDYEQETVFRFFGV